MKTAVVNAEDGITVTGNIVDPGKLSRGGKFAFTELKAGPQAIADEQTDRVSLKIIQGVTDKLLNSQSSLEVTNDPHGAVLILDGYIEDFSQPGKFSRSILFKHACRISVSGEVYDRKSGLRVLSFAASKNYNLKEGSESAALALGAKIGEFIISHTRENQ